MSQLEGVIMRGVRASEKSLPSFEWLATPVEILAGGVLSVPTDALVWGERAAAHVFPYEQADRLARLMTNEITHVYPGAVSREEPHPSAHVALSPDVRYVRGGSRVAKRDLVEDWHAHAKNCGVE